MNIPLPQTPSKNCNFCPRLYGFLQNLREEYPNWHNAPVPSFGDIDAEILVVGLAPGKQGANATGRPFTGDYAGDLLYGTLLKYGFATGHYDPQNQPDTLTLSNIRITNAVRCLPPENKPTTDEIKQCRPFLYDEILAMQKRRLRVILTLGLIAHKSVIAVFGQKQSQHPFGHGTCYELPALLDKNDNAQSEKNNATPNKIHMISSYHCSRYNTQTGRLTNDMFHDIFDSIQNKLNA